MGEDGLYSTSAIAIDGTEEYKFDTEYITSIAYDGNIFIMKQMPVKQQPYDNQEGH